MSRFISEQLVTTPRPIDEEVGGSNSSIAIPKHLPSSSLPVSLSSPATIATQTVAVEVPTATIEMIEPVVVPSQTNTIAPPAELSPGPLQVTVSATAVPSDTAAAVVEPLKPVLDTTFSDESFLPIHNNPTSQPVQPPAPSVPQQQAPMPSHYGYIQMAPDGQLYIYNPQQQQQQQQQSFYPLSASLPAFPFTPTATTHPAHAADTPLPLPSYYPYTAIPPIPSTPNEAPSYNMTARELVQAYSTSKNQLHPSTPTSSSHTNHHHIPYTSSGSHVSANNNKRSSNHVAYTPMSASLSSLSIIDRKKTDIEEIRRKLTLLKQSTSTTHTTTNSNNNSNDLKRVTVNTNGAIHSSVSTSYNRKLPVHSNSTATGSGSSIGTGGLLEYPETMSYYSHLRRPIYD